MPEIFLQIKEGQNPIQGSVLNRQYIFYRFFIYLNSLYPISFSLILR